MIYLALTSEKFERAMNSIPDGAKTKKFLFLSPEYDQLRKWKDALAKRDFEFIELSKLLHEISNSMTKPFLDLLGKLSKKYASDLWWGNRISERNTLINSLFLNCCYLKIADSITKENQEVILILVRHPSLLDSIEQNCKSNKIKFAKLSSSDRGSTFGRLARFRKVISNLFLQSFRGLKCRMKSEKKENEMLQNHSDPPVLLHTYFSCNNINRDGMFKDIYFPGLREWFSSKGLNVLILPVHSGFENPSDFFEVLERLDIPHINPHIHLSPLDYLRAIARFIKSMNIPSPKDSLFLGSIDCSNLFMAERRVFHPDLFRFFLYEPMFSKLRKNGFRACHLIYEFENMIPEKLLNLAFCKYFPHAKKVAYQHGSICSNFLCYFISGQEVPVAPLPDKIVCNGTFSQEILARNGFPEERLFSGPALRYSHLATANRSEQGDHDTQWDVLCPLPLMEEDRLELLTMIKEAYGSDKTFKVCIKPHPMQSQKLFEENQMPDNFEIISDQSLDELSHKSKFVVGMASSSLHEAVCLGQEVIVISRQTGLNFNPLEFFPDINRVAFDQQELLQMSHRILSQKREDKIEYRNRCKKILEDSFTIVSDRTLATFLP